MQTNQNRNVGMNFFFIVLGFWCVLAGGSLDARAQITFGEANTVETGAGDSGIVKRGAATGDFNGDGKLDAAVTNFSSDSLSILFGDGAGGFAPAVNLAVDGGPTAIVTGDFNKDGKLDLVTAHPGSNFVRVRLGDGAGGFTAAGIRSAPAPQALAVGDFNQDGNLDAISANGASNSVTTFFGNGAGFLTSGGTINIGAAPVAVTTGDFNYDGRLDYATANPATDNVSVGLGSGAGGFSAPTVFAVGDQPGAVAAGDFNRDGNPDIVTSNSNNGGSSSISFLAGSAAGGFAAAAGFGSLDVGGLAIGDFDNDGSLDLAVERRPDGSGVNIYRGSGSGEFAVSSAALINFLTVDAVTTGDFNNDGRTDALTIGRRQVNGHTIGVVGLNLNTTISATCSNMNFSIATAPGSFASPVDLTTADFDRDGKLDFAAVVERAAGGFSVAWGDGAGGFTEPRRFGTGGDNPRTIEAADFNNDGKPDLAVGNTFSDDVTIVEGNGIRELNPFSVRNTLSVKRPVKVKAGDFNRDGKLDLAVGDGGGAGDGISIFLGDGAFGFTLAGALIPIRAVSDITVADFNRDGKLDLAVVTGRDINFESRLEVFFGNGAAGFTSGFLRSGGSGHFFGREIAVGDFNRDGYLDMAVTTPRGNIFLGRPGGTFAPEYFVDISRIEAAGDFHNDGKPDLSGTDSNFSVAISRGDGAGGFAPPIAFPPDGYTNMTTGDFNRDGKLDIIAASNRLSSPGLVALHTNTCLDAPGAVDDNFAGRQATTLNVPAPGVLSNDTDFENDPLTAILDTPPTSGTVTLNPNGSFAYTPPAGLRGTVSFTYKASDGRRESNAATVSITINNPPIANNDSQPVPEDGGANTINVLANDTADQFETISIVSLTQGANGAVAVINNGQALTYAPNPNYFGVDSFTYTIRDNNGGLTATATVTVTVIEINDPPTANDDYTELPANSPTTTIDVLANDNTLPDPAGETLRITAVTQSANGGAVAITSNGANLTYRPPANFRGGDSFTYTITDSRGGTNTATVFVDVPNTLTVTNITDLDDGVCDNDCSLREAINAANKDVSRTIIEFAPQVIGTIQLAATANQDPRTHINLSSRIDLRGPGANLLNVRGAGSGSRRVFLVSQGLTRISGLTISNGDISTADGGGILGSADLLIENCVVTGNTATTGGGIFIASGKTIIINSTVSNNNGSAGGGIALTTSSELNITNSTVSGNTARSLDTGAGILAQNSVLNVTNSTISGNSATLNEGSSGGIWAGGSTVTITSSTITSNHGSRAGGLLINDGAATIRNSIIAGNVNNASDVVKGNSADITSAGYNLIGDVGFVTVFNQPGDQTGGGGNPILNPMLAPLANNGGATQTHALLTGSPAIDKGKSFGFLTDQRGFTRPFDNPSIPNASGGDGSDIGAFEAQAQSCANITLNPPTLPGGTVGAAYTQTIMASGGTAPYTFTVTAGTLPSGLTLNPNGTLSGTPNATGTFNFTAQARDANNCTGTRAYTMTITCPTITLSPSSLPLGTAGTPYPSTSVTPSGGAAPYTFTVTGLPAGLTASATSTNVTLSGTPSQAGLFTVTVTATAANGCAASITYRLVINHADNTPGTVLLSEVRTSGPAGPDDEFVELYNHTDAAIAIGGFALAKMGANCAAAPVSVATIPAGTMLPARAHYLLTGAAYSLHSSASANQNLTAGIEDDANLALFSTANVADFSPTTRLDAVGFGSNTGNYCDLLREGATLPLAAGSAAQYSYLRKTKVAPGAGTGRPLDTNDNASDLLLVSTTPTTPVGSTSAPALGAPGPENLASPLQRNSQIRATLLEPALSPAEATNRRRYRCTDADRPANCDAATAPLGYLSIRRTYTNLTGQPVTRLRFRVVDLTTTPESTSSNGIADVRALSRSSSFTVTSVLRSYTVQGLTLEPVPTQSRGGGFNSTLTVTLQTPLAAVDDPNTAAKENQVNVEFLLGIVQGGNFRLLVNVEAAP